MINKRYFASAAAALALSAFAYTEVSEVMTIKLQNGETKEINIEEIAEIGFAEKTTVISFELTPADGGEPIVAESIAPLFRMVPKEDGGATSFAFSTGNAATVDELRTQPYAVCLTLSALSLYTGEVDLTDKTNGSLVVYKYADDALETSWTTVKTGTATTSRDIRGIVTLTVEAEMEDGPTVYATFAGKATDVTSLDGLNPAPVYHNQVVKFNMDGGIELNDNITEVTKSVSSFTGRTTFNISLEKNSFYTCRVEMNESLFGSKLDVPTLPKGEQPSVFLRFEGIQLYSPNDDGRFVPNVATVMVVDNGDGTYTIEADFTNKYTYTGFDGKPASGGTPERVVIQYTGEVK